MLEPAWRVAVVDSGIHASSGLPVVTRRRFADSGEGVIEATPDDGSPGHGTTVAEIIASVPARLELISAEVLNAEGRATPAAVAAAVQWAIQQRAQLIHLSLGLTHDRLVMCEAIAQAVAEGIIVVASTPARGLPSYPAAYPGVIRGTGDARCGVEQISHLSTAWADFGACAFYAMMDDRVARGASIGAAYLTRFIVSRVSPSKMVHAGADRALRVRQSLAHLATYQGAEHRVNAHTASPQPARQS